VEDRSGAGGTHRSAWATLPVLALLAVVVFHWALSQGSGRFIALGESLWPGYAAELRRDQPRPEPPAAAPATDDALIEGLLGDPRAEGGVDDALIADLLADEPAAPGAADDALIADLLADEPAPAGADDALIADLLADEPVPAGTPDDALIANLLGEAPKEQANPASDAQARYERQLGEWEDRQERTTSSVRTFRSVDNAVSAFTVWGSGQFRTLLVLLIVLCGIAATARRHHIALRPAHTALEERVSRSMQLVANALVVISQIALYVNEQGSGSTIEDPYLPLVWAAGFSAMAAIDLFAVLRPDPALASGGSVARGMLAVPLYASMALISSAYFLFGESYLAGLAVYLQKLTEHAQLYVFVGLYVWAGMLLKRTRVAHLAMDVLRPWKLTPELLAIVIVIGAAIPTAYSGASGIFVIAVGGLVYAELIEAGARRQFALAATAMSGSLGVVLRPCLLVVIVAYLNPVTTDVLYDWGRLVFALTGVLFAGVVIVTGERKLRVAPAHEAAPASLRRLIPLAPYAALGLGVVLGFKYLLGASVDEHTAAMILPVVLMMFLGWERWRRPAEQPLDSDATVTAATAETSLHIGALLLLMALSIALGGVFERSDVMSLVPSDLGSPMVAMALLVVVLVVVGMTMDPYGAVILVSATIADVAYRNGIDEAHFWMVVLVAFELGYLTPPVALNHLLTRQVVGAEAFELAADEVGGTWWRRHERVMLPLVVMAIALVIVAFGPLLVG
jgi:TRAP-type C4-dicarboxylate transport system permease large subunit